MSVFHCAFRFESLASSRMVVENRAYPIRFVRILCVNKTIFVVKLIPWDGFFLYSWYLCNRQANKQIIRLLLNGNLSIHFFFYNVYIILFNRTLFFIITSFMEISSFKISDVRRLYSSKEVRWCETQTRRIAVGSNIKKS